MLTVLLLPLLAPTALAAPCVRWIDERGDYRAERVAEVLFESASEVVVRSRDGATLTIPGRSLLDLVREREDVAEERELLEARRAALAGENLEWARPVLDRAARAPGDEKAWVREYAAAARAILAERAGEPDCLERLDRFLEHHATSRLAPWVVVSRARAQARPIADLPKMSGRFFKAAQQIDAMAGPRVIQLDAFVESARAVLRRGDTEEPLFLTEVEKRFTSLRDGTDEIALKLCAESAREWVRLHHARHIRAQAVASGVKPFGALQRIRGVRDSCTFLLPELVWEARHEMAETLRLCGDAEGAAGEFAAAVDAAPDSWRRGRSEEGLARAKAALQPK
ncbi:MAG: hypothetical protein ACREID_02150 [Planctomycetota bacterium]